MAGDCGEHTLVAPGLAHVLGLEEAAPADDAFGPGEQSAPAAKPLPWSARTAMLGVIPTARRGWR